MVPPVGRAAAAPDDKRWKERRAAASLPAGVQAARKNTTKS